MPSTAVETPSAAASRTEAAPPQTTPRPSLDTIGRRCGTDKSAGWHDYLDFYDRFFAPMRDQPVRLLEIGVFRGQSVKMWSEYFPNGQIVGADIDPAAARYAAERIEIEIADQSNIAHLNRLGVTHGPFDIVVDDGSHLWNHQITALQYLFAFVKPGGFFVVEDLDTSFGRYADTHRGNATTSAMQYLAKFADYLVGDAQLDIDAEADPFIRTFARSTEFIAFHRRTAILRRHPSSHQERLPRDWNQRGLIAPPTKPDLIQPLMPPQPDDLAQPAGRLTVHLAFRGDVTTGSDLIGGARDNGRSPIQGFAVHPGQVAPSDIEYRVLSRRDVWSDWIAGGEFAGSRGQGIALRGFAVRLNGPTAEAYSCAYAGAFEGSDDLAFAKDGQPCLTPDLAVLEAMQIVIRRRKG